ncbi:MAG: multicopper oxidase domain-containing protein [Nocardioidaceae bacterium]
MYHCHVQFHSDQGMSGIFLVRNEDGRSAGGIQLLVRAGWWRSGLPEPPGQRHPDLRGGRRHLHPGVPAGRLPGDHARAGVPPLHGRRPERRGVARPLERQVADRR